MQISQIFRPPGLSQIPLTTLHSNDNIQQNNLNPKQLMFRHSSNNQNPQIQFKKKSTTVYFNTSKQRLLRYESPSIRNHSTETNKYPTRTLFSNNVRNNCGDGFTNNGEGTKRGRLVRAEDGDYKNQGRKFEFSKNKVRNISEVRFKKESSPSCHFRFPSKSKQNNNNVPIGTKEQMRNKAEQIKLSSFEFGKKLGQGKFGEVFLVRCKDNNFLCAMKIIKKSLIIEQNFISQLTKQLKIQTYLNHPNIVKMYGFFDDTEKIYILLEYCSSGSLYSRICQPTKLSEPEASTIASQILTGLDQLHYHKILHRDIKPENIFIQHGIVKIGDFGWSTYYENQQLKRSLCGTPLYLSPEILVGGGYDDKIDIWSLGIITYQMIVSRNPWKIKAENHLIRIIEDDIDFRQEKISGKARDFIERALNKKREDRQEASELLNHCFIKQE